MIKKYSGFLLENLKWNLQMLLEANLSATSNFMDRLKTITKEGGSTGKIAKGIYDFIEDGIYIDEDDLKQNYFDTSDKEGMVSFLMQSKLPEDWDDDVDPSLPYTIKGRTDVKVAKIIRYIIDLAKGNDEDWSIDDPTDKDIEKFVNIWKSTKASTDFNFKLVKGKDIARYYNEKRYLSSGGSLGGSCMADENKSIFGLYSENESKVKLLVLIDEKTDKISGRALVWKLQTSPCEARFFMDRVYTNRDSDFFKFRQHAEENGWLYKATMNSYIENNVRFRYKGSEILGTISVKLDGSFDEYPFVDTLCFLSSDLKSLTNIPTFDCSFLHSVSGESNPCSDCDGKGTICDDPNCRDNYGLVTCGDCDGDGDTDSGKCVTCKGKGEYKCDHAESEICDECGLGAKLLISKGIKSEIIDKLVNRK
jgi:hypothetical protein